MRNIAVPLLISTAWHVVCIHAITIISFQPHVQFPRFSEISFVGAILKEPDFEVQLSEPSFSRRPEEVIEPFLERSGRLFSTPVTTPGFWSASMVNVASVEGALPLSEGVFLRQKSSPLFSPEYFELPQEKETFRLEGPARERPLYYRPERPQLPRWIDPKEIRTDLQFRFWISREGRVESIEKLISSGDPTVDLIGMRYLRRWQFGPREEGIEWGIVSFSLQVTPDTEKRTP